MILNRYIVALFLAFGVLAAASASYAGGTGGNPPNTDSLNGTTVGE